MSTVHVYLAAGFEEIEFTSIVDTLRRCRLEVQSIALEEGLQVRGAHGIVMLADLPWSRGENVLADAIVLPGGGGVPQSMLPHIGLMRRVQAHAEAGRWVAAICAAPMVLAQAGVLKNRQATCYPGCEPALVQKGAQIQGYNVVVSSKVITSRGPATALVFALEIARQLGHDKAAHEAGREMLLH